MKKKLLQFPAFKGMHLPNIISRRMQIGSGRHNIAYKTDADDDDDDPEGITQKLNELKNHLDKNLTEKQKKHFEEANAKVVKLETTVKELKDNANKNQEALNELIKERDTDKRRLSPGQPKSFGEVFSHAMETEYQSKQAEINNFQNDKNAKIRFQLKDVGTMTLAANLTGDGQAAYNQRQGIVPFQRTNFRDLVPFTPSPTGLYVTYRETGGEGAIADQVEGNLKGQKDYDFTEVKSVSGYVAGFARFSKQMMRQLPWLQNTLSRMLLRDFYKKENAKFYAAVAAGATGFAATDETDDAMALIDVLMGRADEDFNNSFILVKNSQKGRLLKLLYQNGYYMGSGSVLGSPDGTIKVADTPVIGVSWATSDKVMIIDSDFIERVETSGLAVEFSYDDVDNFQRNLVTARVECQEDLNALRWDAHTYVDMGNES